MFGDIKKVDLKKRGKNWQVKKIYVLLIFILTQYLYDISN